MWKAKLRYNIVYTWMKEPEEDLSKQGDSVLMDWKTSHYTDTNSSQNWSIDLTYSQ